MQNVAGDDQVQTFGSELAKERDCFRPDHGVHPIQRLVENQYRRLMSDCLREANSLSHSLAVCRNLSIAGLQKTYPFQRRDRELFSLFPAKSMHEQERLNEFSPRQSAGKRIKLGAITKLAKKLLRLICGNAENRDVA